MSQRQLRQIPLNIHLHTRQFTAFTSLATEILYGGAAGGGKSHLMRCAAIIWCAAIKGLQIYLFRREHNDLVKNHMEGPKGFRNLLAAWEQAGLVKIVEDEIRFWNGSKIYLCHCQHEKHRFKYHGAEIHVLLMDELTHFTETIYRYLRNRVRMVGIDLPEQYRGMFPRIVCSSNPGNIGHGWVKASFVDNAEDLALRRMSKTEGGMLRQFIRAKLEDNPSMTEDDPTYEDRLEGLGSAALVKAMRWGDWDVVEGAFFDNFDAERHVIRPATLPTEWTRFRGADWGSAKPFSIGWYAIVSDDWKHPDGKTIPRGALVKYREWYGVRENPDGTFQADVGLKMTAEQVAHGIIERERGDKISYGALDPAAFAEDGGPSIAERMQRYRHPNYPAAKVLFREADNKRVPAHGALGGWDQVRSRLDGDHDNRPMLYFFSTCRHTIRTVPALQHDQNRPEDVMTDSEDHCFAAGTMVETDVGPVPIEQLPVNGLVHSIGGLQPYRSARLTRHNAGLVRLTFVDGRKVICTPDHKFLVDLDEWRYASELKGRSVLCSALPRSSRANSAIKTAKRVRCVAVEELSDRADVYCLTVPETGCFAIEGGILVSNCGDETRYACMSRPYVKTPKAPLGKEDRWNRAFAKQQGGGSDWKSL